MKVLLDVCTPVQVRQALPDHDVRTAAKMGWGELENHAMDHAGEVLQTLLGNILAFRCINASRRLDAFWKYRSNQHAARNDVLALAS